MRTGEPDDFANLTWTSLGKDTSLVKKVLAVSYLKDVCLKEESKQVMLLIDSLLSSLSSAAAATAAACLNQHHTR